MDGQQNDRERVQRIGREMDRIGAPEGEIGATPHFRLIFITVVALTVLALLLNVLLAVFGGDSEMVQSVVETCSTTYKMGFGAIVGLTGRKAL